MTMDFQSAMETFAEAWVAANTKGAPLADASTQVKNQPPSLAARSKILHGYATARPSKIAASSNHPFLSN